PMPECRGSPGRGREFYCGPCHWTVPAAGHSLYNVVQRTIRRRRPLAGARPSPPGSTCQERAMSRRKAAVITGSTSGIGLGMARALAGKGIDVMLNGLGDAAEIERIRQGVEQEFGVSARFHGADMTRPGEIAELIAATHAAFGAVDILVNNAGIQHVAPVDEFPTEQWDRIIAINLSSSFHTIR